MIDVENLVLTRTESISNPAEKPRETISFADLPKGKYYLAFETKNGTHIFENVNKEEIPSEISSWNGPVIDKIFYQEYAKKPMEMGEIRV